MRVLLFTVTCALLTHANIASAQTWTARASVPGNSNEFDNPVYFTAANKIYVGGGIYGITLKEYDPSTNMWQSKADIPGTTYSRVGAISFSANGKGYIGLGADFNSTTFQYTRKTDLVEYDPSGNTYTPKASFPGTGRSQTAWFVINDKVIMIGGADSTGALDEVWEYNITSNSWSQKQAFPAGKITGASGFTANGKGYIVLGNLKVGTGPAAPTKKLFEYDATNDTWIAKPDYPGTARFSGTAFVLNNKAYVGMGASIASQTSYTHYSDFYAYDPTSGWGSAINTFPGAGRQHLASAVVNGKGYVGTGWTYISGGNTYYRDWYEFSTTVGVGNVAQAGSAIKVYPNPAADVLFVEQEDNNTPAKFTIYNMIGQTIATSRLHGNRITISNLANGEYILEITSANKNSRQMFSVLHR